MTTARMTKTRLRGDERPAVPVSKITRALVDMLGITDADIDDIRRVTIHPDAIEVEVYPTGGGVGRFFASMDDGEVAVDSLHFPIDKQV